MGSRYARRLARRFTYGLATHMFWLAILGCVSLGILFGWIMFAEPHKLGAANIGNTAEVVAALGTWVIGVAACWYAHQSYMQRLSEDYCSSLRVATATRSALTSLILKCTVGKYARTAIQNVVKVSSESASERIKSTLTVMAKHLSSFSANQEERALMTPEQVHLFEHLALSLELVHGSAVIIARMIDQDGEPRAAVRDLLADLLTDATDAEEESNRLIDSVRAVLNATKLPQKPKGIGG